MGLFRSLTRRTAQTGFNTRKGAETQRRKGKDPFPRNMRTTQRMDSTKDTEARIKEVGTPE